MHNCNCQGATKELERKNSATLGGIKEERESVEDLLQTMDGMDSNCRRCDSGMSTADNSVGEESSNSYKESKVRNSKRLCTCQYYKDTCTVCSTGSSSGGSSQDNAENQQDSIIEEGSDRFHKRCVKTSCVCKFFNLNFVVIAVTTLKTILTWRIVEKCLQSQLTTISTATHPL